MKVFLVRKIGFAQDWESPILQMVWHLLRDVYQTGVVFSSEWAVPALLTRAGRPEAERREWSQDQETYLSVEVVG